MAKVYILVATAAVLLGSTAAIAGSGEYKNMDAMKLTEGKGLITKCDISGQYDGKTYCFGDETTKAAFMKEPAGNRAKADAIYATKASDPNWKACNYETASQEGCE